MSESKFQFPHIPEPISSKLSAIAENLSERIFLTRELERHMEAIPADGFYSWSSVKEFLIKQSGGIVSDGKAEAAKTPLLAGVSGGADSIGMLLICRLVQADSITCCHVNHRTRGDESDRDEEFVREDAAGLQYKFVVTRATDSQAEEFKKRGSEERFRDFRYAAFNAQARAIGARSVLLAHTLNDQIETVLFRAFRGSSSAGLRGIPCVRIHGDILLSRPLIDVSRDDIELVLSALRIRWRNDSSNADVKYSRNFIRAEIIPRIESEFHNFGQRLETMRQLIADDEELLKALCLREISQVESKNANRWQLAKLAALPSALKRRMFAQALRTRGIEVSFERVEKLLAMSVGNNELSDAFQNKPEVGSAISLNERWDVVKGKEFLMFVQKDEFDALPVEPVDPIAVRVPGITIVPALNKVLCVEEFGSGDKPPKRFPLEDSMEAVVALGQVKEGLVIRERLPGDCIQPFGMQEIVKLKKYLHTHKRGEEDLSNTNRRVFVLACGEEVLWVPGVGISEKLRVLGAPTHVLKLLDIDIGETTLC